jgi:DNA-binding beta-propeller fold protein YncE
MNRRKKLIVGGTLAVLISGLWVGQALVQTVGSAQRVDAPRFEVDPFWPKPLPNMWVLGSTIGAWVDDQDLVWIVHRPETLADNEASLDMAEPTSQECCRRAPPVMAFDMEGNVVHAWGGEDGPGYTWPASNHGIFVDHLGFVWIGGNGAGDSHVLKFTKDGRFVAQFGEPEARRTGTGPTGQPQYTPNSNDPNSYGRVAKVFVDPQTSEVYLSDGYFNRRVAVIDHQSGDMLRYWGAYGNRPDDSYTFGPRGANQPPAQQFRGPVHCADISQDRLVYVCDRQSNRLQVFTPEGEFVREAFYAPETLGEGSTWDVAFSRDPQQRYIFLADGRNQRVRVIDRQSLEELTNFGRGGRYPGHFFSLHSIATDSQGNIYTTETYQGKRIQKFVARGVGPVTTRVQGAPYPQ